MVEAEIFEYDVEMYRDKADEWRWRFVRRRYEHTSNLDAFEIHTLEEQQHRYHELHSDHIFIESEIVASSDEGWKTKKEMKENLDLILMTDWKQVDA